MLPANYVQGPGGGFASQNPCMQWVKANGDASFEDKCRVIFVPTRGPMDIHTIVGDDAFQAALKDAELGYQ